MPLKSANYSKYILTFFIDFSFSQHVCTHAYVWAYYRIINILLMNYIIERERERYAGGVYTFKP